MQTPRNVLKHCSVLTATNVPLVAESGSFSAEETELIARVRAQAEAHQAGTIIQETDKTFVRPVLVLSGWVSRQHLFRDGRRQILQYILPGDLVPGSLQDDAPAFGTYVALTPIETADATQLMGAAAEHPDSRLAQAVRFARALEQKCLTVQIARIGQQTSYERVASLMLEFHDRLTLAGLVEDGAFHMPLTQEVLAKGLGLSVVHVNRTIRDLRRSALLSIRNHMVHLNNIVSLRDIIS
jgi:CRP-like cAMP-binding protein